MEQWKIAPVFMKIIDVLKSKKQGVSFEFFPPKTSKGFGLLEDSVVKLSQYNPLYMSMTYGAGGSSQEKTKDAVYMMMDRTKNVIMPHLTCIGATRESIGTLLKEYKNKGIYNIMALRGDIPKDMPGFDIKKGEFNYGVDLVSFIKNFGHFSIGVAVYPEGHIESDNLDIDLKRTKSKIDAGADFGVTQMFFDNRFYFEFCERCVKSGIHIPIIPGILPVTDLNKLRQFVSICRTTIPKTLCEKMAPFLDKPQEMEKIGIEFTINQCKQLLNQGVKFLHFFTLNKPDVMELILRAILAR